MQSADKFNGSNKALGRCIKGLLYLDATGALVPHGIGGHARVMLGAAAGRLAAADAEIERLRGLFKLDGEQHSTYVRELTKRHEQRITKYAERIKDLERQNDATYVAQGADAYDHACEEMERFQAERVAAGKDAGCEGSLCDGMSWLYGRIKDLEADLSAHKAENTRLRGIQPELPPYPPDGRGLPRYGLRWNGPAQPVAIPMDDGYWTPWHLAAAAIIPAPVGN